MFLSDGHKLWVQLQESTQARPHVRWVVCSPWEPVVSVVYQAHGSDVGWKCDGDPQPGETVLQDTKERRGQERRLQEIQQQLEILGRGQEMTVSSKQLRSFTHNKTHAQIHTSTDIHTAPVLCIIAVLSAAIRRHVCNKLLQDPQSFSQWDVEIICNTRVSAGPYFFFYFFRFLSLLSFSLSLTLQCTELCVVYKMCFDLSYFFS